MDKKQLRKSMIQELQAKSTKEKWEIEQKITETLLSTKLWKRSKIIGITISQHIEWDTKYIIKEAWTQGKTICIPKIYPNKHEMIFYKINSFAQVKKQHYDLVEPILGKVEAIQKKQIDLLIVPGLAFDKAGFRIGFGGGYYDRFLADFPNDTLSLLGHSQLINEIPSEHFDIPVKYLVVENEFIEREQI